MIVENRSMSYQQDTKHQMVALLAKDPEAWSSLSGLMAILALPAINGRRRTVEVEVAPDVWQEVDSVAVEQHRVCFWFGANGSRTEYTFSRAGGGAPRWRVPPQAVGVLIR